MNHMYGWTCKKYRNKEGMKTQEDYPTKEKGWKRKTRRPLYICCLTQLYATDIK